MEYIQGVNVRDRVGRGRDGCVLTVYEDEEVDFVVHGVECGKWKEIGLKPGRHVIKRPIHRKIVNTIKLKQGNHHHE